MSMEIWRMAFPGQMPADPSSQPLMIPAAGLSLADEGRQGDSAANNFRPRM